MGRHLWLMHSLLPLVIGLSTPPKPLPLAERPQAAEQIVTPGAMLAAAASLEESVAALPVDLAPSLSKAGSEAARTTGELLLHDIVPPLSSSRPVEVIKAEPVVEVAAASSPPPPPASPPPPEPPMPSRGRFHRRRGPPPPPRPLEDPLLGDITTLSDRGSLYVRTHLGVEAAFALLLSALLSLCALGCVVRAFCDYSLCCFSRGPKRVRLVPPY